MAESEFGKQLGLIHDCQVISDNGKFFIVPQANTRLNSRKLEDLIITLRALEAATKISPRAREATQETQYEITTRGYPRS